MRIDQIELHNFRNFEQQTFRFPSLFTVVIGENGKGKSTLLQALRLMVGTVFSAFTETKPIYIQSEDVRRIELENRFAPQLPAEIRASGSLKNQPIDWERIKRSFNGESSGSRNLHAILSSLEKQINTQLIDDVDLPVLAFFSTARIGIEPKKDVPLKTKGSKIADGYEGCLDAQPNKDRAFSWIKSNYYKSLKGQNDRLLKAVLDAISQCVPNWTAVEWDEDSDDLLGIYRHEDGSETRMPLYYLSDG